VVVRAVESVAPQGRGLRKRSAAHVADAAALSAAWPEAVGEGSALVQRAVRGRGEGIFLLRWGGRTRAAFAHARLREKPPAGGVSVLRESIALDRERLRSVEALLDELRFEGVAMAEFKNDGRTPWLIELNARLWGSLQLAADAGIDFPRLLLEAVLGGRSEAAPSYAIGVRSRWLLGDLDHALALARGESDADGRRGLRAGLRVLLAPAGPRCRWEVFRRGDPRPFAYELRRWIQQALR
jgi:predicted ATP-grasp superfamily ATP-dependent carboligase